MAGFEGGGGALWLPDEYTKPEVQWTLIALMQPLTLMPVPLPALPARAESNDETSGARRGDAAADGVADAVADAVAYLAQHDLFGQIPALADDIRTPDYTALRHSDNEVRLFLSGEEMGNRGGGGGGIVCAWPVPGWAL